MVTLSTEVLPAGMAIGAKLLLICAGNDSPCALAGCIDPRTSARMKMKTEENVANGEGMAVHRRIRVLQQ